MIRTGALATVLTLALLRSAPAGAQEQVWPRMPLQRVVVGDSLVFEVSVPYGQQRQQDLLLVFLRSPAFPGSGAFATAPDSLAAFTRDPLTGAWVPVGGIGLDLFTIAVHLDDFDRNGRPDLFVEWFTGGNGAASSGGAIFEFRFEKEDRGIRTTFHSDTSVSPVDLDTDGIWEFAVADEYWGLARAHYQAARYWLRIYRPDPLSCGYTLVNDLLPERVLAELRRPAEYESQRVLDLFRADYNTERAVNLAAAFGEVIAWRITSLDGSATVGFIDEHQALLDSLITMFDLPVRDVRGLQTDALATINCIREEIVHPRFTLDPAVFDDIREAVVRDLVKTQGFFDQAEAIELMVHDGDESPGRMPSQESDPNTVPELTRRLVDLDRSFVLQSACELRKRPFPGGYFEKETGRRVIRYRVGRIRYRDPDSVTIAAGYYWGGLMAAGMTLILRREGDRWEVIGRIRHWIS
jgi:hypothetical protein